MNRTVARHRDFRLLFSGQAISVLGDALLPIALASRHVRDLPRVRSHESIAS